MTDPEQEPIAEAPRLTLRRYMLVIAGWAGVLACAGWVIGAVPDFWLWVVAMHVSGMAGLYGHHGLEMGWFDAQ